MDHNQVSSFKVHFISQEKCKNCADCQEKVKIICNTITTMKTVRLNAEPSERRPYMLQLAEL